MEIVFLILSVYAVAVLETALGGLIEVRHVVPDLMALVAVTWLLVTGRPRGFLAAAAVGLASDLTSAGPAGIGMAAFAVVGYGIVALRGKLDMGHPLVQLAVAWAAFAAITLGEGAAWRLTSETALAWPTLAVRAVAVANYTAAVSLPVLLVIDWRRRPRVKAMAAG